MLFNSYFQHLLYAARQKYEANLHTLQQLGLVKIRYDTVVEDKQVEIQNLIQEKLMTMQQQSRDGIREL